MNLAVKKSVKTKDGVNLYYETTSGDNSKPTLFLIHGVGGDLDAWQFVKQEISLYGFPLIAMDLRGHGFSDHPRNASQYQLHYFIEDLILILNNENIKEVILIGHSLGAVLSTHIALASPDRIKKLILISSSYIPPSYFKIPGVFSFIDIVSYVSPPPLSLQHSYYPPGKIHKDVEYYGLARTIIRNSLRSYLMSSREILKTDIGRELKNLEMPTLIISGDQDTVFPIAISEYIHSQIHNSTFKVIRGANHVVVLNNPNSVVELIMNFLQAK